MSTAATWRPSARRASARGVRLGRRARVPMMTRSAPGAECQLLGGLATTAAGASTSWSREAYSVRVPLPEVARLAPAWVGMVVTAAGVNGWVMSRTWAVAASVPESSTVAPPSAVNRSGPLIAYRRGGGQPRGGAAGAPPAGRPPPGAALLPGAPVRGAGGADHGAPP